MVVNEIEFAQRFPYNTLIPRLDLRIRFLSINLFPFLFSISRSNTWALCPSGFYLEGIYISDSSPKLYHIEEAKCCRPQNHPDGYDGCYDEDVGISFDHKGWSQCKQDGHYMAGFYKSGCNELYCIEKFRCCKMKKGCYQTFLACLFTTQTIAGDLFNADKIVTVAIDNLNAFCQRK